MALLQDQLVYLNSLGILGGFVWILLLVRHRGGPSWPRQTRALVLFGLVFLKLQTLALSNLYLAYFLPIGALVSGSYGFLGLVFLSKQPFFQLRNGLGGFLTSLWPLLGIAFGWLPAWSGPVSFLLIAGIRFRLAQVCWSAHEDRCELRLCFFTLPLALSSLVRVIVGYHHLVPTLLDILILVIGLGQAWNIIVQSRPIPVSATFKDRLLAGTFSLPIFFTLIFAVWGVTGGFGHLFVRHLENQMLEKVRLVQTAFPKHLLLRLTGTELDSRRPEYIELTEKLLDMRQAVRLAQRIYLLRPTIGKTHVFADSEPVWSQFYTPPGTLVNNIPGNAEGAHLLGVEGVYGQGGQGKWVSVLVSYWPYDDLFLLLGMDILRTDWEREIRIAQAFPLSLGFLFLVLTVVFIGIGRDSWLDRLRQQEAEWHLRIAAESADLTLWSWPPSPGLPPKKSDPPLPSNMDEWLRFLPSAYRHQAFSVFREHMKGRRQDFELLYPVQGVEGKTRWFFDRGRVLEKDAAGRPTRMAGTRLDITERRQATEREREAERRMLAAQKWESLGLLAGGVAHDFNNIFAAILGNIEMAEMDLQAHPGRAVDYLRVAAKAVSKASDLTQKILAFAGKSQVHNVELDVNQVIREQFPHLRASIRGHIELRLQLLDLPKVEADPAQIQLILMNLVLNAGEAIGDANGTITVQTSVQFFSAREMDQFSVAAKARPGLFLTLSVIDDGPGMREEVRSRLFEPFFTTRFLGRGLGLPAVQGIVCGFNGCVRVRSSPGQGAEFLVGLPLVRPPP